jgi:DNA-directed RNA polymerase specialized sigma24 family protein
LLDDGDDNSMEDVSETAELVHGQRRLSVDHRRVLTLRFLEDMSIEEIADVLATNSGTIKSRLYYAKAVLAPADRGVDAWLNSRHPRILQPGC